MERIPSRWRYTVFAFMIWLFLVAYILWTGNVYGYVIIALFGVFILAPVLVVVLGNRGRLRRLLANPHDRPTTMRMVTHWSRWNRRRTQICSN